MCNSMTVKEFLNSNNLEVLGNNFEKDTHESVTIQQKLAWKQEVIILQDQLREMDEGRIVFEYDIPRLDKRIDVVILYKQIVFLLEFKCGDGEYYAAARDQVYDYALDLYYFHKESKGKLIVPIAVIENGKSKELIVEEKKDLKGIVKPILCNGSNIITAIEKVIKSFKEYLMPCSDYTVWEKSVYLPTPTIIEAAKELYHKHNVKDIHRSDADNDDRKVTTSCISRIIEDSKTNKKKSICFVTGVPGAGKTLVGLNLSIDYSNADNEGLAVYISGNYPLVQVLKEALARDKIAQDSENGIKTKKKEAEISVHRFIQIIHKYRDSSIDNSDVQPEHIAIFDEAQRCWTKEQLSNFMKRKKSIPNYEYSEPESLIQTMDRHKDWAVIVCLVGGGQEINTGEAGLQEWFDSLKKSFPNWEVYVAPNLNDNEYLRDKDWSEMISGLNVHECPELHLSTSIRSLRTPELSAFVKNLLDVNKDEARKLLSIIKDKRYPIYVSRNLSEAKQWIRNQCVDHNKMNDSKRYGIIASSGGLRLKPEGIFVKNNIDVKNWFLNDKTDVRSSYAMEDVVTEFAVQGLELDYAIIAWDADMRFNNNSWVYRSFKGNKWNKVEKLEKRMYIKNAYRVLLTRARSGMVIFVPMGDERDETRNPKWYDSVYNYLSSLGIPELKNGETFSEET